MKGRRGFLLLEVMASIVVITGGLLFVMRVYSTAKLGLDRSRDLFKYALLLEDKIYDFEERGVIEEGRDQDHFPVQKEYSWEVEAVPLAPQSQYLDDLCAVKLNVFYGKGSPPDKYSLFTYLNRKT